MNGAHYGAMSRTVRKIITDMILDARPNWQADGADIPPSK